MKTVQKLKANLTDNAMLLAVAYIKSEPLTILNFDPKNYTGEGVIDVRIGGESGPVYSTTINHITEIFGRFALCENGAISEIISGPVNRLITVNSRLAKITRSVSSAVYDKVVNVALTTGVQPVLSFSIPRMCSYTGYAIVHLWDKTFICAGHPVNGNIPGYVFVREVRV